MSEQASHIVISGGQFYYSSSTYSEPNSDAQALHSIHRIIQKDISFNKYSALNETATLPVLSKDLLLGITSVITDAAARPASTSCCFDLLWRLGLLYNQPNSGFAEYEYDIPVTEIVTRHLCCCARISRHGLVHLISRFFQDASVYDAQGPGPSIAINTTIGRFRCYEIDDRTFVHFDSSIRYIASPPTELIDDQDLDHILRIARGQYLMMDSATFTQTEWRTEEEDQIPACAAGNYFSLPNAIMYMSRDRIATWTLLRTFGRVVATCTLGYIDTLTEPQSFADLLTAQQSPDFDMDTVNTDNAQEALAQSVYICRLLLQAAPTAMTHEYYYRFANQCMQAFTKAHQHYRSPRAVGGRMFTTSQERFLRLFREYQAQPAEIETTIISELQGLQRHSDNNIALVMYQVFIGLTVHWNAGRILGRTQEVPPAWIRFVSAEDDYIYLG